MSWQYTAYTALLFTTTGMLVALALYAQRRRTTAGATAFMWLALVVAEWTLTYQSRFGKERRIKAHTSRGLDDYPANNCLQMKVGVGIVGEC